MLTTTILLSLKVSIPNDKISYCDSADRTILIYSNIMFSYDNSKKFEKLEEKYTADLKRQEYDPKLHHF